AGSNCVVYSILELWSYDSAVINALTQQDIIDRVNTVTTSPMYGNTIDVTTYLGSRTTNSSGSIVEAQAAILTWLTLGNDTMESITESWETKFIELGRTARANIDTLYVLSGKSWQEESGKAIDGDVSLLSIGYFLVILFVLSVLGKFNLMEQRAWLTLGGFICIGLSILVSIGLSSAFQQGYGPLQSVLPFLLLGIGVDDMFVIMGALNNLKGEELDLDIPQKVGQVLRHAGVSITVTSFTDFVAFMVGATTIIPALRSFCIYAAVGIMALYVLQAVFFTACLTLDLRRLEQRRDGCCFCCVTRPSPPYVPNACSQRQVVPHVFSHGLASLVTKLPFKVVATVIALALLGVNIWGFVELELYFDSNWFLPDDSYARDFTKAQDRQFPEDGFTGYVYCGNLDYFGRKAQFETLGSSMDASSVIYTGTTDSWFTALTTWLADPATTDTSITSLLDPSSKFFIIIRICVLFTLVSLCTVCPGKSARVFLCTVYPGKSSRVFLCTVYPGKSSRVFLCTVYPGKYVYCVLCTLVSLCTVYCVLCPLVSLCTVYPGKSVHCVDVAGTMHFWNLTIDTVTSIILILSIGLAVDYSAHIGHMFMTRTKETLGEMGPCVFYGGFSTFLAFILLSNSNSYVFSTFFKVNFLVVLYGLFHGLVFLPVLLSWLGPPPYPTATRDYKKERGPQGVEASPGQDKPDAGTANQAYVVSVGGGDHLKK
ncbi:hypothetical protein EGW08_012736, partial [Elysia chlorotica]